MNISSIGIFLDMLVFILTLKGRIHKNLIAGNKTTGRRAMIRTLCLVLLVFAPSGSVYSDPFNPIALKISAPQAVSWDFATHNLTLPVSVTGTSASVTLLVYTHDKSSEIKNITNGFLGWHYVNKIDTCIYVSSPYQFEIGDNNIVWDGKMGSGTPLTDGYYTFYLWGFDNKSPKIPAMRCLNMGWREAQPLQIESKDASGNLLSNPVIYHSNDLNSEASATNPLRMYKWRMGDDPDMPISGLEWTTTGQSWGNINRTGGSIALDPNDHAMIYVSEMGDNYSTYVSKYQWISNGAAKLQTHWGIDGSYHWTTGKGFGSMFMTGVVSDGEDLLFVSYSNQSDYIPFSQMLFLDKVSGDKIKAVDLSKWYCSQTDLDNGGQMNGGPTDFDFQNGLLTTHGNSSCITLAIDPYRPNGDEIVWVNSNGDFIHDKNFSPVAEHKWMCNDLNSSPFTYTWKTDPLGFSIFPVNNIGYVNFGIIGPSGMGIGNFGTFSNAGSFGAVLPVNVGTAYDGLYMDNPEAVNEKDKTGIWYIGQDSCKGVFTKSPDFPTPYVKLTSPIGGEIWEAGQTRQITWIIKGTEYGQVNTIRIYFSTDGGRNYRIVADNVEASRGNYIWYVPNIPSSSCLIRIFNIDYSEWDTSDSTFTILPSLSAEEALPEEFAISRNTPNPFNPSTTIFFSLSESGLANLSIYNLNGQKVREIVSENLKAGKHSVFWDGRDDWNKAVSSGVYFARLIMGKNETVRKMLLIK
jgi:flagellar hook assembly protein FlgD